MSRVRPMRCMARCGPVAFGATRDSGIVAACAMASAMEPFCIGDAHSTLGPAKRLRMPSIPHTLADFDFRLPESLIAQQPASARSASRLLDGRGRLPTARVFRDLPQLFEPGDLLVFNDTRVIKARLYGEKPTGGAVEALIERVLPQR